MHWPVRQPISLISEMPRGCLLPTENRRPFLNYHLLPVRVTRTVTYATSLDSSLRPLSVATVLHVKPQSRSEEIVTLA